MGYGDVCLQILGDMDGENSMMSIYDGTPGTGKSLHVIDDIRDYLRRGCNVIANFDFRSDLMRKSCRGEFLKKENRDLQFPDWVKEYGLSHNLDKNGSVKMGQTLLVIDEAQNVFDARQWNCSGRKEWNEFFAVHRHYGFDIILITQNIKSLDKRIQANAEFEVLHRNMKHYKNLGFVLSLFFGGHLFVWVKRYLSTKDKVASKWFIGSKRKFRYYDSFVLFEKKS
jgi:zona occludens toxin